MPKKIEDQYSPEETKERMIAALRGARIAGYKPLKDKPKVQKAKVMNSKKLDRTKKPAKRSVT